MLLKKKNLKLFKLKLKSQRTILIPYIDILERNVEMLKCREEKARKEIDSLENSKDMVIKELEKKTDTLEHKKDNDEFENIVKTKETVIKNITEGFSVKILPYLLLRTISTLWRTSFKYCVPWPEWRTHRKLPKLVKTSVAQ